MRILHVNKFLYRRGGAEGYMLDVAALQRRAGHEVALWGMHHPENDAPLALADTFAPHVELEPAPGGLAGVAASLRMVWNRQAEKGLRAALERFRPDVVHCHNIYHQLSPSVLRPMRRAGVPVVMTLHDYKLACPSYQLLADGVPCEACVGHGTWHAAARRCKGGSLAGSTVLAVESGLHRVTGAYDAVDRLICPSAFLAEVMRRQGIDPQRLRVVGNFTDVPPARPREDAGRDLVYAGRLSHEKGVEDAVRAVARTVGDAVLHVAGDGPLRGPLEELAGREAPGRVVFHGRLGAGELADLLRRSRALLLPARWHENQPMIVLEAYAAGLPVVVTDLGGLPELVTDGVHGFVVPAGDPAALAAAADRLLADPALALALGAAGRARLEDGFGATAHLARLEEVYSSAAAQHPGTTSRRSA